MGLDALDGFVILRLVSVSYRAYQGRFCLTAELAQIPCVDGPVMSSSDQLHSIQRRESQAAGTISVGILELMDLLHGLEVSDTDGAIFMSSCYPVG